MLLISFLLIFVFYFPVNHLNHPGVRRPPDIFLVQQRTLTAWCMIPRSAPTSRGASMGETSGRQLEFYHHIFVEVGGSDLTLLKRLDGQCRRLGTYFSGDQKLVHNRIKKLIFKIVSWNSVYLTSDSPSSHRDRPAHKISASGVR